MELDDLFRALADSVRRQILDELDERDGQTLFEIHNRLVMYHGVSLTRQGLSKHLGVLEKAGLVRCEWRWRSKHHFIDRGPMRAGMRMWLDRHLRAEKGQEDENRDYERSGR